MAGISEWELRNRAKGDGPELSQPQFKKYCAWGILPELPEGGWTEQDVEKVKKIRALGPSVPLHRRIIRLRNLDDFIVPPEKLREAMIATLPSIRRRRPVQQARRIYWAQLIKTPLQSLFDSQSAPGMTLEEAKKHPLPESHRPPASLQAWEKAFRWPTETEFDRLAGQCYVEAIQLSRDSSVVASQLLDDVPFEELVIHLLTYQLTIGEYLTREHGMI